MKTACARAVSAGGAGALALPLLVQGGSWQSCTPRGITILGSLSPPFPGEHVQWLEARTREPDSQGSNPSQVLTL